MRSNIMVQHYPRSSFHPRHRLQRNAIFKLSQNEPIIPKDQKIYNLLIHKISWNVLKVCLKTCLFSCLQGYMRMSVSTRGQDYSSAFTQDTHSMIISNISEATRPVVTKFYVKPTGAEVKIVKMAQIRCPTWGPCQ